MGEVVNKTNNGMISKDEQIREKYPTLDMIETVGKGEEIARIDGSQAATIVAANSLGTGPLSIYGSKQQKIIVLKNLPDLLV